MKDLDDLTVNDAKNWYQTWYAPNNATVVVVGDVDSEKVYQLVQKYFGAIPKKTIPALKSLADQTPLGERTVVVSVPAKLPWLVMGYNVPTLPNAKTTWEPYALQVLSGVLSAGSSGRLQRNLVRGQQIASDADDYYDLTSKLPNLFVIYATPTPKFSLNQLQHAVQEQINQLSTQLISEQELQRVKNALIAERIFSEDSLYVQAQEIGAYESVGLGWQKLDDYTKQIDAITPAQIQAVVKKYLTANRLVVGYLKPKS
jgi:zinc protease